MLITHHDVGRNAIVNIRERRRDNVKRHENWASVGVFLWFSVKLSFVVGCEKAKCWVERFIS